MNDVVESSPPTRAAPGSGLAALLVLFFLSGAAALVYQVLWLKQLTRLFGVNAHATAVTLSIFFLGLAVGGWVWGRRVGAVRRPLRVFAGLELAVGASALLFFGLFAAFRAVQTPLLEAVGHEPVLALVVKSALALLILFPPAFFMGGTLPVMAQYLVRRRSELGRSTTLLYAVNTLGAATGALAAGFVLPRVLGLSGAYLFAIAIDLTVAAITWWWSRSEVPGTAEVEESSDPAGEAIDTSPRRLWFVAGFSGLAALGLEVLWTRMFSQVLQNSVYTFAIILTVFLASLAVGSALANRLCRRTRSATSTLVDLLAVSGLAVAVTPLLFQAIAGGLEFWNSDLGFWPYVGLTFAGTAITLGPAVAVMGAVFPFLMKVSEPGMRSAGRTVGELAAVNTVLAILGSLLAGFVLLGTLGVWASIWTIAAAYFVVSLFLLRGEQRGRRVVVAVGAVGALALAIGLDLEEMRIGFDDAHGEEIVEMWQGPDAAVAVTRHDEEQLRLRINSSYNLGSSASAINERLQGQLPGLLHPDPRSAFFIGLGTGITASGAMHFPYERITVTEVNPDVVTAARRHFQPWLEGLFDDPRVDVVAEDGRIHLSTRRDRYDVITADIFLSYKAGVGALYTLEHFETVRDRLNDGGVFVQWFGAFDMSRREFDVLARTLLEVFPQVTLWRRSFSPVFPVYAFVATTDERPLDVVALERDLDRLVDQGHLDERVWLPNIPLAAYVANLTRIRDEFAGAPLNTDDRTVLEYMAPVTERQAKGSHQREVLAWEPLLHFCQELHERVPPESDPYLRTAPPEMTREVRAGTAYYGYEVMRRTGRSAEAARYRRQYERLLQP